MYKKRNEQDINLQMVIRGSKANIQNILFRLIADKNLENVLYFIAKQQSFVGQ